MKLGYDELPANFAFNCNLRHYNTGMATEYAHAVPPDDVESCELFRRAADSGHPCAQVCAAFKLLQDMLMYDDTEPYTGVGDVERTAEWLRGGAVQFNRG